MDQAKPTPKLTRKGRVDIRGLSDEDARRLLSAMIPPFLRKLADRIEAFSESRGSDLEEAGLFTQGIGWLVTIPLLSESGETSSCMGMCYGDTHIEISDHAAREWLRGQALAATPSA